MLKGLLTCSFLVGLITMSYAQLDVEDFSYTVGDVTGNTEWSTAQGGGVTFDVFSPGLTYTGYPSSGVGNALNLPPISASLYQANHAFPSAVTSGTLYMAFMLRLNSVNTSSDYFAAFTTSQSSTTVYDRIFIRDNGANAIFFGLNPNFGTSPDVTTGYNYALNTTYIVVLKHEFIPTQQYDDEVTLYVIEGVIPATEPAPTLGPVSDGTGTNDPASLSAVALMTRNNTQDIDIDGIRVATTWADLFSGVTSIEEWKNSSLVSIGQNKPNPASVATIIPYVVAQPGVVDITVYDAIGNVVANPVDGVTQSKGVYSTQVDVSALQPGIYFYSIKQNGYIETKKMIVGP